MLRALNTIALIFLTAIIGVYFIFRWIGTDYANDLNLIIGLGFLVGAGGLRSIAEKK